MNSDVLFAFFLTLIAGLSTGIGSIIAFFAKKTNTRFLSFALGFSAGVMIYVSMIEIFSSAQTILVDSLGNKSGQLATVIGFFAGMVLIGLIDFLVPEKENPHEVTTVEDVSEKIGEIDDNQKPSSKKLLRTGMMTALALAIHNFPEGLATFVSALQEPTLALPIVFAIAIHNIPEGIAVSVPIYYATNDKKKAFIYSFLSGLAEPLGAIVGYLIIMPFLNDVIFGMIFAGVAGIMVFISLDELLPSAREYGEAHLSIFGVVLGMLVMAISLLLFV